MTVTSIQDHRSQKQAKDIAVQLNTRVSLETRNLIDTIAYQHGYSIREIVELAIVEKWTDSVQEDGR